MADLVALSAQLVGQLPGALQRVEQGRLRISPGVGSHQCLQGGHDARLHLGDRLGPSAGAADPVGDHEPRLELFDGGSHRRARHPGCLSDTDNPAPAERTGLGRSHDPALPFIKMREDHGELLGQRFLDLFHAEKTTPNDTRSRGLFSSRPLVAAT